MKNNNYIVIILLCVISSFSMKANAQQFDENTFIINQYFQSNKDATVLNGKTSASNIAQVQDNYTILNQVGNNNQIDINSRTNNSQTVSQLGNNNEYQFINYYNKSASEFNISQQGNSNSLEIYGTNSIIKNISIMQTTNFDKLIIKNY